MKNKTVYLFILFFLFSNVGNGQDWTIKLDKDKQEITVDTFNGFSGNLCKICC